MSYNYYLPMGAFIISLILLGIRLNTKQKNHFLLSMLFIILGSILSYSEFNSSITRAFLFAIIISFVGDLFMAEKLKISDLRIVDGAIAFSIAHIIYAQTFITLSGLVLPSIYIWVAIILSLIFFYFIAYNKDNHIVLQIASLVYAGIISYLFVSIIFFIQTQGVPILAISTSLIGILLFMISDGVLAYNEFKKPIPRAKDIIAITYILAQILLQSTIVILILLF